MRIRATLALAIVGSLSTLAGVATNSHEVDAAALLPEAGDTAACSNENVPGEQLHRAGVVVVFPDGVATYCVSFAEDELSGAELLQRTGLDILFGGFGGLGNAVCRIDGVGCSDPGNCWCQCQGADCHYWSYFELEDDNWRLLQVGASQRRVQDGDVDGWVWGNGRTPPGTGKFGSPCPNTLPTATPVPTPRLENGAVVPRTTGEMNDAPPPDAESFGDSALPELANLDSPAQDPMPTETPPPKVLGQSSRPTDESVDAARASEDRDGNDFPIGLLSYGAVGAGIIAAAGIAALRRTRGG